HRSGDAQAMAAQTTFPEVTVTNDAGQVVIAAAPDPVGDGAIVWAARTGPTTPKGILLVSDQNAGQVALFNTAGVPKYILDGNAGLLAAPGDLAERFPVRSTIEPGSVVAID